MLCETHRKKRQTYNNYNLTVSSTLYHIAAITDVESPGPVTAPGGLAAAPAAASKAFRAGPSLSFHCPVSVWRSETDWHFKYPPPKYLIFLAA